MRNAPLVVHTFVAFGLLTACGAEPRETAATPAPAASAATVDAKAEAKTAETKTAETKSAEPNPPGVAAAEPTPAASSSALHVVALREGAVDLFVHHQAPVLSLEGEPVPWVGGRFAPQPDGARGLPPTFDPIADTSYTLALGGDSQSPLPTWVTYEMTYSRSGPVYAMHHREGERWRLVEPAKGSLVAHYHAYVEREGALLGLQVWSPKVGTYYMDEEGDEKIPANARIERALKRARPTWVRLAGAEIETPKIPAKTALTSAVTTSDGTLYAITEHQGEDSPHRLLRWRPGEVEPETVAVPGLDRTYEVSLSTTDDWVLAHGGIEPEAEDQAEEPYLALGHAGAFERVPMALPLGERDVPPSVLAAARAPDGTLFIALGPRDISGSEDARVWRKPAEGSWEAMPLPRVETTAFGPSKEWMFEGEYGRNDWVEHERGPIDHWSTQAVGLAWAAGAVWVALQLDGDSADHGPRSVVLTNDPKATTVTVLPPVWKTELDRANAASRSAKPGGRECLEIAVVLGPASLATEHPEIIEALAAIEVEGMPDPVRTIYVAQLDGTKVLVTHSEVLSLAEAEAVRKAAAAVTGTEVRLMCEIPMLETVVKSH